MGVLHSVPLGGVVPPRSRLLSNVKGWKDTWTWHTIEACHLLPIDTQILSGWHCYTKCGKCGQDGLIYWWLNDLDLGGKTGVPHSVPRIPPPSARWGTPPQLARWGYTNRKNGSTPHRPEGVPPWGYPPPSDVGGKYFIPRMLVCKTKYFAIQLILTSKNTNSVSIIPHFSVQNT